MKDKKIGNSIFKFERDAGIDSPLGNWRKKSLKINYVSYESDEYYFYIRLWISWSGLKTKKATLTLYEHNTFSSNTKVFQKDLSYLSPSIVLKVPKISISNIDTSFEFFSLSFFVEIKSNMITSKTEIFYLDFNKGIKDAYFAEQKESDVKTGKYKEYTFNNKHSFTGSKENQQKKKEKIAGQIYNIIKKDLNKNKQETNIDAIISVLTKNIYNKGDTIDIPLTEKQKIYSKLEKASIGDNIFIVVETEGLIGEKVKIKIREKEGKLIILRKNVDSLPVLVFDEIDDKTTDTEEKNWIEIEIKKVNKKEIGVRKIQLRPKQEKISHKNEESVKSKEGWEEALFLREDETIEGKKAIEDAKKLKNKRKTENFITLLKNPSVENISYPKRISGPANVQAGKDAVFFITEYNYQKTSDRDKDKNNIQWSLWIKGENKDKYIVIDTKTKPKLYTYAKCELVDGKNKLTIVFDKELIDKTVQIEPFRNNPDINNKKDYVRTVKIAKISKPKIIKFQTAKLWLQTQCDECKEDEKEKEFLKDDEFKLEAQNRMYIYNDGTISKISLDKLKFVRYIYVASNGEEHNLGKYKLVEAQKWKHGSSKYHQGWKKVTLKGKTRYYEYDNGKVKLIKFKFPLSYNFKGINIKLTNNSTRDYINPEAYACLLGALAEVGYDDITLNGFTSEDGTGAPSVTHYNGIAGDFRYLRKDKKIAGLRIDTNPNEFDIERQEKFIDALVKFGWKSFYSYNIKINNKDFILKKSTHLAHHNNHLHARRENFKPNYK